MPQFLAPLCFGAILTLTSCSQSNKDRTWALSVITLHYDMKIFREVGLPLRLIDQTRVKLIAHISSKHLQHMLRTRVRHTQHMPIYFLSAKQYEIHY